MPVMLDDADVREPLRAQLRDEPASRPSVLYPAVHEFTAYRGLRSRAVCRGPSSPPAPS